MVSEFLPRQIGAEQLSDGLLPWKQVGQLCSKLLQSAKTSQFIPYLTKHLRL